MQLGNRLLSDWDCNSDRQPEIARLAPKQLCFHFRMPLPVIVDSSRPVPIAWTHFYRARHDQKDKVTLQIWRRDVGISIIHICHSSWDVSISGYGVRRHRSFYQSSRHTILPAQSAHAHHVHSRYTPNLLSISSLTVVVPRIKYFRFRRPYYIAFPISIVVPGTLVSSWLTSPRNSKGNIYRERGRRIREG